MKIHVEGSGHKDLFVFLPESLIVDGLDNDNEVSPYQKASLVVPLSPELQASLDKDGNHTPLVVEQRLKGTADKKDGQYVVVAGTQRTRNARVVNAERAKKGIAPLMLQCVIRTDLETDPIKRFAIMISENSQRRVVSDDVNAEMANWLINVNNYPVDRVAKALGRATSTINAWLADHGFTSEVKTLLKEKVIEKTTAREVSRHAPEKQARVIAAASKIAASKKGTREGKISLRDVKAAQKLVDLGFIAPSRKAMMDVIRTGIPEAALETLLWATGQAPMPDFLAPVDAGGMLYTATDEPLVDAEFEEMEGAPVVAVESSGADAA